MKAFVKSFKILSLVLLIAGISACTNPLGTGSGSLGSPVTLGFGADEGLSDDGLTLGSDSGDASSSNDGLPVSGASGATDEDLILDDDTSLGIGSMGNPENLPVTMSKFDPEEEECNETTQGDVMLVTRSYDPEDLEEEGFEVDWLDDEDDGDASGTLGQFMTYFSTRRADNEDPDVHQCQVFTGEDGEDVFVWVKIDFEDVAEGFSGFFNNDDDDAEEGKRFTPSQQQLFQFKQTTPGSSFKPGDTIQRLEIEQKREAAPDKTLLFQKVDIAVEKKAVREKAKPQVFQTNPKI